MHCNSKGHIKTGCTRIPSLHVHLLTSVVAVHFDLSNVKPVLVIRPPNYTCPPTLNTNPNSKFNLNSFSLLQQDTRTSAQHMQRRNVRSTARFICVQCRNSSIFRKLYQKGRDSSVGTVTRYGLDGPGIESRWRRHFPHPSRPALGPTQPPVQ